MTGTLCLSRADLEKRITYPPLKKKQPKLPPLRCDLSQKVLAHYRAAVREKKKAQPMANFDIVAATAAAAQSPSAHRTFEEGLKLMENGEYEDATAVMLEAVKMGIDSAEIYALIGDLYRHREMAEQAIAYYTKSLEAAPSDFSQGQWDQVRLFKEKGDCYLMLASAVEDATAKAADEYDKYLLMSEPTFDFLLQAGKAHLDSGNLQRAKELFDTAERINTTDAYLHFNLGELHERLGNVKEAKEHFSKSIQIDPEFPYIYVDKAEEFIRDGAPQSIMAALNLYLSVLKLLPTNGDMHIRIADIYDILGPDYVESSKAMLTRALQLSLTDERMIEAYVRRGQIYVSEGAPSLDSAIADFSMCLALTPANLEALRLRAEAFLQRSGPGDRLAAVGDFEALISCGDAAAKELERPLMFLGDWYFDHRFECGGAGDDEAPVDSTTKVEHYIAMLAKTATVLCRAGDAGISFAGRPKEFAAKMTLALSVSSGFYSRLDPEPAEPPPGASAPVVVSEEMALKPSPLLMRVVEAYYLHNRRLEPTAHSDLFNEFLHGFGCLQGFGVFYEGVAAIKAAANDAKGKKKKK
eukprot:TRINITY_DN24606_c0_g1_i1.p1 TRINITY_DN24606_c0_g1~~TRINITY_DN24606_c0_g1_i1.p1  ORF type:complete len:582 (+),score=249.70 TRINITY_DN24606_c0_g1_i1:161-1906(+)